MNVSIDVRKGVSRKGIVFSLTSPLLTTSCSKTSVPCILPSEAFCMESNTFLCTGATSK